MYMATLSTATEFGSTYQNDKHVYGFNSRPEKEEKEEKVSVKDHRANSPVIKWNGDCYVYSIILF